MISRDGRWLLYHSTESGRPEVYILRLDAEGGKWHISTDGGARARCGRDERKIIFLSDHKLMIVDVQLEPAFSASIPRLWMDPRLRQLSGAQYQISPDGSQILVNRPIDVPAVAPVTIVQNWAKGLSD